MSLSSRYIFNDFPSMSFENRIHSDKNINLLINRIHQLYHTGYYVQVFNFESDIK